MQTKLQGQPTVPPVVHHRVGCRRREDTASPSAQKSRSETLASVLKFRKRENVKEK